MKKEYVKPEIKAIELIHTQHLLAGSQQPYDNQDTDDWLNYAPGIDKVGLNLRS